MKYLKLLITIITIYIIFPSNILAASVKDITIMGKENITLGETFTESLIISYDGIEKAYDKTLGIVYVKYEISFDDNILLITDIETPDWDTIVYEQEDKYYVLSTVNTENRFQNKCYDGILYCGPYNATIEFFPIKSQEKPTEITITNIETALLDINDQNKEYTIKDLEIIKSDKEKKHALSLTKDKEETEIQSKETIVTKINSDDIENQITKSLKQEPIVIEESSNLLRKLVISGHDIEFNKYKNNYLITIPENKNTLDLQIVLEDKEATYEIVGHDDLKKNDYKVTITVTSKDKKENIYTINVEQEAIDNDEETKPTKLSIKEIYHKYQTYFIIGGIALGIIIIIIIITKIVSKIKDNKLDKMTDKF